MYRSLNFLENKHSIGPDGFSNFLLKKFSLVLALPFFLIFKKSFAVGKLPSLWKTATVVPIYKKKGGVSSIVNYRPISLTCNPCRICERFLIRDLNPYLERNKILTDCQHGFRKRRSCETQLLESLDHWTKSLNEGYNIDIDYMDISRAFDSVPHPKMLTVLQNIGLKGNVFNWIEDFLSKRTQRVKVNNALSSEGPVTSGVPQGSCLSPILFNIYINDLPNVVHSSKVALYADDAKVSLAYKEISKTGELQADLERIAEWARDKQLRLATKKCSSITLGHERIQDHHYLLDGELLERVTSIRDLGIIINSKLNFNEHCMNLANRCGRVVNCLLRNFQRNDIAFLVNMYKTFARSILDYGSLIYSPRTKQNSEIIESIQRNFTRRILKNGQLSYEDRLQVTKLEKLSVKRLQKDLIAAYKILNGYMDVRLSEPIELVQHKYDTRAKGKALVKSSSNIESRKHFFSSRVSFLWD